MGEDAPLLLRRPVHSMSSGSLEHQLLLISIAYLSTIGVSGLVLSAVGTNLEDIAIRIGAHATDLGGQAFMVKGIGSILAAPATVPLYENIHGDVLLFTGLICIAVVLLLLPFTQSSTQLYLYFFLLGFFAAMNDTGCNILARKKHGKKAGPWLAANGIAFGSSAAIVPIVDMLSSEFIVQNLILGGIVVSVAFYLMCASYLTHLNEHEKLELQEMELELTINLQDQKIVDEIAPHHNVEIVIGIMVFCICGIQVTTASYIMTYLEQSKVVSSKYKNTIPLLFWIFWSIGRVVGVFCQVSFIEYVYFIHQIIEK